MSPFGKDSGRDDGDVEKAFQFTDRRRIDPETGELRGPRAAADPGNPANAAQPITATVTANSDELALAKLEAAERTSDLQRISAEYANYRKRTERDRQQAVLAGKAAVLTELLPVLDDLDRAEAHGDLTGPFKTVADKLLATLNKLGLNRFGAQHDEFDPTVHEAVQFATSAEVAHPTVTAVLRHGYTFSDRLVRPAVVAVTGPEHDSAAPAGGGFDVADGAGVGDPAADDDRAAPADPVGPGDGDGTAPDTVGGSEPA